MKDSERQRFFIALLISLLMLMLALSSCTERNYWNGFDSNAPQNIDLIVDGVEAHNEYVMYKIRAMPSDPGGRFHFEMRIKYPIRHQVSDTIYSSKCKEKLEI